MKLNGNRPDDYYRRDIPEPVPKTSKTVQNNIETRLFKETKVVGYKLKDAA